MYELLFIVFIIKLYARINIYIVPLQKMMFHNFSKNITNEINTLMQ